MVRGDCGWGLALVWACGQPFICHKRAQGTQRIRFGVAYRWKVVGREVLNHEGTKEKDGGPGHHALGLTAWGGPSLAVAGNYSLTTNGHELTLMSVNFVCLIAARNYLTCKQLQKCDLIFLLKKQVFDG